MTSHLDFEPHEFQASFGKEAFAVRHRLADHPLFGMGRLLDLARFLPPDRVEFNAGELPIGIDPALTPMTGLTAEETIRRIAECKSWLVLKNVERDPEYGALLNECLAEVEAMGHPDARRIDRREAFVFVSSPGSVTPYHIDPEWNFLLQVRGSKTITVFPPDPSILSEAELERFYSGAHRNLVWKEEYAAKGVPFTLQPGDGVHVPVTAPHWVKNGPEVSVSFSITFQTRASERRGIVYKVNHALRKRGMNPPPVGRSGWRDGMKVFGYRVLRKLRLLGKKEG
ncbi:MAG: cupin-like domain-containing protein [Gemmataceae bacterium]|nr:cupin-like domain-containing protein [Gemmataceae bacterium]